jgi:hypothetical protein
MDKPYRSSDLALSAYFYTQEVRFLGIEPKDGRSLWFLFSPFDRCSALADDFFSGRATVSARGYADALRRCKDQIFQKQRELQTCR